MSNSNSNISGMAPSVQQYNVQKCKDEQPSRSAVDVWGEEMRQRRYISDKSIKNRYVPKLRMRMDMMKQYAIKDKLNDPLINEGYSMYCNCGEQAKQVLAEAIVYGFLKLKGYNDLDSDRKNH